jgi:hypothetical protein
MSLEMTLAATDGLAAFSVVRSDVCACSDALMISVGAVR